MHAKRIEWTSALGIDAYIKELKRNLVAAWIATELEKYWLMLTDKELADMVSTLEAAKARMHKEKRNAKLN